MIKCKKQSDSVAPTASVTEVLEKPKRRRFSVAYKQRILDQAEQCSETG